MVSEETLSMWILKSTTYDFLLFLIRLKLSNYSAPSLQVDRFIRRHRSRYDTSLPTVDSYDNHLI